VLSSPGYKNSVKKYREEIEYDRPVYNHFVMSTDILDVGGEAGSLREFLNPSSRYISIDSLRNVPVTKQEAFNCLAKISILFPVLLSFPSLLKNHLIGCTCAPC
jgi:hypothetical protein